MDYCEMGNYFVWHGVWHILVGPMAQRYASYFYDEGASRSIGQYLYAQPTNAVCLDASDAGFGAVCFVYFGVEAVEKKESLSIVLFAKTEYKITISI